MAKRGAILLDMKISRRTGFLCFSLLLNLVFVAQSSAAAEERSLLVLTYNIAGLPDWISQSTPSINTPIISQLINQYDLVVVQEDFEFHAELSKHAKHAHRSINQLEHKRLNSDGLNRFSNTSFQGFIRVTWNQCHGYFRFANDCLAVKGFSMARHQMLPHGGEVDVYNLHADAGRSEGDKTARRQEFQQLAKFIMKHSKNRALIIAGDTNLHGDDKDDEIILATFLQQTKTLVSARVLSDKPDGIDRIMYRGSASLLIEPINSYLPPEFFDDQGNPLSDHPAVATNFRLTRLPNRASGSDLVLPH